MAPRSPAQQAALKKAQEASARKRRGTGKASATKSKKKAPGKPSGISQKRWDAFTKAVAAEKRKYELQGRKLTGRSTAGISQPPLQRRRSHSRNA